MITPTEHEKTEWLRLSRWAAAHGNAGVANKFWIYSGLRKGVSITTPLYNELKDRYCAWLVFSELKPFPIEMITAKLNGVTLGTFATADQAHQAIDAAADKITGELNPACNCSECNDNI